MRLVRLEGWRTGLLLADGGAVDVAAARDALGSAAPPDAALADWSLLIAGWDGARDVLAGIAAAAEGGDDRITVTAADDVRLLPPLPVERPRVFAIGANFADHAARAMTVAFGHEVTEAEVVAQRDAGATPPGFHVVPETIVATGATIVPPAGVGKLDYEAEVAVVLDVAGRAVRPEDVAIWGYAGWNDLSIRDHFFGGTPLDTGVLNWALQKNFEGSNPCGPWLCVDEPTDPSAVQIRSYVNGELRQDGTTTDMLYSFAEIAAYLSRHLELRPGDMIVSGTPGGTAVESGIEGPFLRGGDEVVVEIEGAGSLRTRVGC